MAATSTATTARESERLDDQAGTLVELLHHDTAYPAGSRVLEAGCGVGAQTVTLAARSPGARITSDRRLGRVAGRRRATGSPRARTSTFQQADIFDLPFAAASFDHVFVCFVLEHLREPVEALAALRDRAPAGRHDHRDRGRPRLGLLPPRQRRGGRRDRLPGRAAGPGRRRRADRPPAVPAAGRRRVRRRRASSPRWSTSTASRPALIEAFTRKHVHRDGRGRARAALAAGLLTPERFDAGVAALERTATPQGTFNYTFFKAVAAAPG